MDAEQEAVHLGLTSWLFVAIATQGAEFASPLSNVMASADFLGHSIPSVDQLRHAMRDLTGANLVTAGAERFAVTPKGQEVWKAIGSHKAFEYESLARARPELRRMVCLSESPGWSIDQNAWELALAAYSRTSRCG